MDQSSRPNMPRARALVTLAACCLAFSSSNAFQFQSTPLLSPRSIPSEQPSTALHARKGNRGPNNKKFLSDDVAKRGRPQINDVLDGINDPPAFPHSVDPADVPPGPVDADPLAPLVHTIVKAADMRKASDIVAMRVTQCTSLTNFVVIVSGTSRPQNQAIASAISKDVEELYDGKRCLGRGTPEGSADSGWILLDYGEVMVHVMTPKSRLFYDMDGQWEDRGGEYMNLSGILVDEMGGPGVFDAGSDEGASMKERLDVEKEIDPFWS